MNWNIIDNCAAKDREHSKTKELVMSDKTVHFAPTEQNVHNIEVENKIQQQKQNSEVDQLSYLGALVKYADESIQNSNFLTARIKGVVYSILCVPGDLFHGATSLAAAPFHLAKTVCYDLPFGETGHGFDGLYSFTADIKEVIKSLAAVPFTVSSVAFSVIMPSTVVTVHSTLGLYGTESNEQPVEVLEDAVLTEESNEPVVNNAQQEPTSSAADENFNNGDDSVTDISAQTAQTVLEDDEEDELEQTNLPSLLQNRTVQVVAATAVAAGTVYALHRYTRAGEWMNSGASAAYNAVGNVKAFGVTVWSKFPTFSIPNPFNYFRG